MDGDVLSLVVGKWRGANDTTYDVVRDEGQQSCTVTTTQATGTTWVAPSSVRLGGSGRVMWSGSFVLDCAGTSASVITWASLMTERHVIWQKIDAEAPWQDEQPRGRGHHKGGGRRPLPHEREIRQVWSGSLAPEFDQLVQAVARAGEAAILSLCIEFPGLLREEAESNAAEVQYEVLRDNVNQIWPLQIGLAVSSSAGMFQGAWNFNLQFDKDVHGHNDASLNALQASGVDFERHKEDGIDGVAFGQHLGNSPLVGQFGCNPWWLTFSGSYHFGFLLKLLTMGRPLPEEVENFLGALTVFCPLRYDLREQLPVRSLNSLARKHSVRRHGSQSQAGSSALLALELYLRVTPGLPGNLQPELPDPPEPTHSPHRRRSFSQRAPSQDDRRKGKASGKDRGKPGDGAKGHGSSFGWDRGDGGKGGWHGYHEEASRHGGAPKGSGKGRRDDAYEGKGTAQRGHSKGRGEDGRGGKGGAQRGHSKGRGEDAYWGKGGALRGHSKSRGEDAHWGKGSAQRGYSKGRVNEVYEGKGGSRRAHSKGRGDDVHEGKGKGKNVAACRQAKGDHHDGGEDGAEASDEHEPRARKWVPKSEEPKGGGPKRQTKWVPKVDDDDAEERGARGGGGRGGSGEDAAAEDRAGARARGKSAQRWHPKHLPEEGATVCRCVGEDSCREAMATLLGTWHDDRGTPYELSPYGEGRSLSVSITKEDGSVIHHRGRVNMKPIGNGEIHVLWGVTHLLGEIVTRRDGHPSARWLPRTESGRVFKWEKKWTLKKEPEKVARGGAAGHERQTREPETVESGS